MIARECMRLAEVEFPLVHVLDAIARDKGIPHDYRSSLHLWWARLPLAWSRTLLLALLLPDPCDPLCPPEFGRRAREILAPARNCINATDKELKDALLGFIGEFAAWDRAFDPTFLAISRALVDAAHSGQRPLVVDPFAGTGSIPLEALRLNSDCFASDLNPVAWLHLKFILDDIPRRGPGLSSGLRRAGEKIRSEAAAELGELYPADPNGGQPIAYLWARTVRCESAACGAEIPLLGSFWLCKIPNNWKALRYTVGRPRHRSPHLRFEIFAPASDADVPSGTMTDMVATCPCCCTVLPSDQLRVQLCEQCGGADVLFDTVGQRIGGAMMLAVVSLNQGSSKLSYRLPTERDYAAVFKSVVEVGKLAEQFGEDGVFKIPNEPIPKEIGSRVSGRYSLYSLGIIAWGALFTARQKLSLSTCAKLLNRIDDPVIADGIGLALSRTVDRNSALCTWRDREEKVQHVFSHQTLQPTWEFAEAVPFVDWTGGWSDAVAIIANTVRHLEEASLRPGHVSIGDARQIPLSDEVAGIWFANPPHPSDVPYTGVSQLFLVWLKRALPQYRFRVPLGGVNKLTVKSKASGRRQIKSDIAGSLDQFGQFLVQSLTEARRVLCKHGVGLIILAHETTDQLELLLSQMILGGLVITASWPLARNIGLRAATRGSKATATACVAFRSRIEKKVGVWEEVSCELSKRIASCMSRLRSKGICGANLAVACIGPALESFSRYSRVETEDGHEVLVGQCLQRVWQLIAEAARNEILNAAGTQPLGDPMTFAAEDGLLTALLLWSWKTMDSQNYTIPDQHFGERLAREDSEWEASGSPKEARVAEDILRRLAVPFGIDLDAWYGRIIDIENGRVRLLTVSERLGQLFGRDNSGAVMLSNLNHVTSRPTRMSTLDCVHSAMVLHGEGLTDAKRSLVRAEKERGPDFFVLCKVLSALYAKSSEEKRILDTLLSE